jgi:anti-sigma B factor antagonist
MLAAQQRAGNTVLVCEFERLDASQAGEFREQFNRLSNDIAGRVVLDMSSVNFVDSTGLGAVVACMKSRTGRGDLALAGVSGLVAELFQLTRLDGVFSIFDSVDDALG